MHEWAGAMPSVLVRMCDIIQVFALQEKERERGRERRVIQSLVMGLGWCGREGGGGKEEHHGQTMSERRREDRLGDVLHGHIVLPLHGKGERE